MKKCRCFFLFAHHSFIIISSFTSSPLTFRYHERLECSYPQCHQGHSQVRPFTVIWYLVLKWRRVFTRQELHVKWRRRTTFKFKRLWFLMGVKRSSPTIHAN
jgi:hypothetical protein